MNELLDLASKEAKCLLWWHPATAHHFRKGTTPTDLVMCTATVEEWVQLVKRINASGKINPDFGLGFWCKVDDKRIFVKCPDLTILPFYDNLPDYGLTATWHSVRWYLKHK